MTADSSTEEEPALTIPRPPRFWASPFGWSFAATTGVAVVCALLLVFGNVPQPAGQTVLTLKGVMASKGDFFDDKEVQRLLRAHNISVEVTRRGSREVALEVINQQTEYDFAFPSGQPAADLIKNDRGEKGKYHRTTRLFSSPIVLASYREYAETLARHGTARPHEGKSLYYTLDTAKFVALGEGGTTWNGIGIREHTGIANGNRILAHSSGVCRSNSAATYLGLIAFVRNGSKAPGEADIGRLAQQLQPLFAASGMPESELFRTYVTPEGKSQGPVIVVYEHQFLAYQIAHQRRTGRPDTDRVLLYPTEEFQTDPEFISLNESGQMLATLLASDPALRERMKELGYRVLDDTDTTGTAQLFKYLDANRVPPPALRQDLTSAAFPPLNLLEELIVATGGCKR